MSDSQSIRGAPPIPTGPKGVLSIRTLAMPADTNQNGDIFGGWLLSQMDLAGAIFAYKTTLTRNVTVAIDDNGRPHPITQQSQDPAAQI